MIAELARVRRLGVRDMCDLRILEVKSVLVNLWTHEQMRWSALQSTNLINRCASGEVMGEELVYLREEYSDEGSKKVLFSMSVDFGNPVEVQRYAPFVPRIGGIARLLAQAGNEFNFPPFEAERLGAVKGEQEDGR